MKKCLAFIALALMAGLSACNLPGPEFVQEPNEISSPAFGAKTSSSADHSMKSTLYAS